MDCIENISTFDARYHLPKGAGSDAVHTDPAYCLAVTRLRSSTQGRCGTGFALTLGEGNRLVCDAIELLARPLLGRPIEELMAEFGRVQQKMADNPVLRWLGPHKGVVHLALASITNACFDLWAKCRGVPLWRLPPGPATRGGRASARPELSRRGARRARGDGVARACSNHEARTRGRAEDRIPGV